MKATASCAGPGKLIPLFSPIRACPACQHLNPVYGMKADSQEMAHLTVPTLYYIKAPVLSLRLGVVIALRRLAR